MSILKEKRTVLFVHGLESGPTGPKARTLQAAGFDVVSVQMPSSRREWVRDPITWLPFIAALVAVALSMTRGLVPTLATVVLVALSAPAMRVALTRRMWNRSLALQREQLRTHAIDVVVGSSFGGAVALELLARGDWSGPTVLLCPAHRLLAARARLTPSELPKELRAKVLVVHGRADETVPLEHSRALVDGRSDVTMVEVDDDHRLTANSTPERFREWVGAVVELPSAA